MKNNEMAKKGLYVGTGVGLILFTLVGLLTGSLIGGLIGLKLAELIHGAQLESALLTRVIVALSMIVGVIGSAVTFVAGMGFLGWVGGFIFDEVVKPQLKHTPAHPGKGH